MSRIAVVGAGSWGLALSQVLAAKGDAVTLWCRRPEIADEIIAERTRRDRLPDLRLTDSVTVTADLAEAAAGAELVIAAVPTHGMRETASRLASVLASDVPVVSAAKGFELQTDLVMTAVLREQLPGRPVAALSGPNIASEIAAGLPAASVVASDDASIAGKCRDLLTGQQLRVYSSTDLAGVEYAGALKNVVAIAAGICDGIHSGDNGKAALMTRGLTEMARLSMTAGADPLTVAGLAGIGDCVVTCMSRHSRNRALGEAVARGASLETALPPGLVVEGVNATRVAVELGDRAGVDVPISAAVHGVLFEGVAIPQALANLMTRDPGDELRGLRWDGLHSAPPAAGSSSGG